MAKDWTSDKFRRLEEIKTIFSGYGKPLSQCAIAWLLRQETVTSVMLGPRTLGHFLDNVEAMNVTIVPETLEALNALQPVRAWGVPPLRD